MTNQTCSEHAEPTQFAGANQCAANGSASAASAGNEAQSGCAVQAQQLEHSGQGASGASAIPVISVELMRASDAYTIANFVDDAELMNRAGRGIAQQCRENFSGPYALVCGSGNNGGDGYVAARYLAEAGHDVTLFYTKPPASDSSKHHAALLEAIATQDEPDSFCASVEEGADSVAARAEASASADASADPSASARSHVSSSGIASTSKNSSAKVRIEPFTEGCDLSSFATVVDCLLGTGFNGEPRGLVACAIDAINAAQQAGAAVVSADINSGVNGDTGTGTHAVKSSLTVSVGYLKTGMLNASMNEWAERITNIDIGIQLLPEAVESASQSPKTQAAEGALRYINTENLPSWIM